MLFVIIIIIIIIIRRVYPILPVAVISPLNLWRVSTNSMVENGTPARKGGALRIKTTIENGTKQHTMMSRE